jgi:hypothetical protein
MVKGQRVVCINDSFSQFVRALYKQLPVKDKTYTIREVFLGREKIVNGNETATVGLLLEELHNPTDPFHAGQQELGFSSERFAILDELPDEEAEAVEEEVGAGVIGFPGQIGVN